MRQENDIDMVTDNYDVNCAYEMDYKSFAKKTIGFHCTNCCHNFLYHSVCFCLFFSESADELYSSGTQCILSLVTIYEVNL